MQKILIAMAMFGTSIGAAAESASVLVYRVWEKGADPYISRVLVNADYVRLDEGDSAGGYTLFDRQQEIIYNVQMSDRSVLVMNADWPPSVDGETLILQEQVELDEQAPKVAGAQPKNVRLLANGELCSEMVVIEGVMEDALEGLRELKLTLARVQSATLEAVPLDMRTPCDLAANVYAADRSLKFGLPLQERSAGRSQSLVDFMPEHEADDALFQLPADFSRRSMFGSGAI